MNKTPKEVQGWWARFKEKSNIGLSFSPHIPLGNMSDELKKMEEDETIETEKIIPTYPPYQAIANTVPHADTTREQADEGIGHYIEVSHVVKETNHLMKVRARYGNAHIEIIVLHEYIDKVVTIYKSRGYGVEVIEEPTSTSVSKVTISW